jgi:hypothetical protein
VGKNILNKYSGKYKFEILVKASAVGIPLKTHGCHRGYSPVSA